MQPIRLTFAGLRSYRSETTIDFTDLDLFAIIGDTGAGKSTIIEALSFALYGRKTWSGGSLTDLITDGQTTMRIEFDFEAAGDRWTVTRSRHRNSGAPVNRLVSASGGDRVDGAEQVTSRIEQLLGLDHAQFTKAVVMPQGRFDELLRARPSDRTKILTSILGLDDVVTVRERAEGLRDQWRPELERTRARRTMLPADPVRELELASSRQTELASLVERLTDAVKRLDEVEPLKSTLEQSTERLRVSRDLVPDLDDAWCDQLDELARQHNEWSAAVDEIKSNIDATRLELSQLDQLEIEQLHGLADRDALVSAQSTVGQVVANIESNLMQLEKAKKELEELRSASPPEAVDQALVSAQGRAEEEAKQAADLKQETSQLLAEGRAQWSSICRQRDAIGDQRQELLRHESNLQVADTDFVAATKDLDEARNAYEDAKAARELALSADAACRAAAGHAEGDDCPVCARPLPSGFEPPAAPDVTAADEALSVARKARDVADAKHRKAERDRNECESVLRRAQDTLRSAEEVHAAAMTEASDAGVDTAAESELSAVRTLAAAAEQAAAAAQQADNERQAATEAVEEARRELHGLRVAHEANLSQANSLVKQWQVAIDDHRHRLDDLPDAWRVADLTTPAVLELDERLKQCRAGMDELNSRRVELDTALDRLKQDLEVARERHRDEIEGPARAAHGAIDRWASRVNDLTAAVAVAAETAGHGTPTKAVLLDEFADDLAAVAVNGRSVVESGGQLLLEVGEMFDVLAESLGSATAEMQAVIESTECATPGDIRTKLGESTSELTQARNEVEAAAQAVAEAGQLDELLTVLEPYVCNLSVLAVSLRDSNFIRYLVASREADLLGEATRRLKVITGGKFGFAAGFNVVNLLSGEKRPPDTLSGGERFQAALGLALSLVEIASRGGGRLDAVFIDEGFGSLDSNALDVALDALANVSGDGKSVALISHLRPVAEYVDKVLHVSWDDVNGSKIAVLTGDAQEHLLADDARSGLTS